MPLTISEVCALSAEARACAGAHPAVSTLMWKLVFDELRSRVPITTTTTTPTTPPHTVPRRASLLPPPPPAKAKTAPRNPQAVAAILKRGNPFEDEDEEDIASEEEESSTEEETVQPRVTRSSAAAAKQAKPTTASGYVKDDFVASDDDDDDAGVTTTTSGPPPPPRVPRRRRIRLDANPFWKTDDEPPTHLTPTPIIRGSSAFVPCDPMNRLWCSVCRKFHGLDSFSDTQKKNGHTNDRKCIAASRMCSGATAVTTRAGAAAVFGTLPHVPVAFWRNKAKVGEAEDRRRMNLAIEEAMHKKKDEREAVGSEEEESED